MRKVRIAAVALVALLPAVSAATEAPRPARHAVSAAPEADEAAMARLIGRAVVDPDGATIGEIEDVVRLRRGGVNAVIASGGLFGLGVRRVAVPVGELEAPDATGPVAARRLTAAEAGALSAFDAAADAEFSYRSRVAQR